MKKIKIEMIHDVVCSWCPIGYQNLKQALVSLEGEIEAQWYFLPFELNPDMPAKGQEIELHLMERYGWSTDKLKNYRANLIRTAEKAGLTYDFSKRTHYYNTSAAHQLLHWAEGIGKQVEVNEALITDYFENGRDVSNPLHLLELVESLGLDAEQAKNAMSSASFFQQFQLKHERVRSLSLGSVPAFIFNEQYLITGSNSVGFFQQQLLQITNSTQDSVAVA